MTQPLLRDLWTDAGRTQVKLNRADVRISEMTLRQRIHEVVRDVMLDYYELVFAREDVLVKKKRWSLRSDARRKIESEWRSGRWRRWMKSRRKRNRRRRGRT